MKQSCVVIDLARLRQTMRTRGWQGDTALYPGTIGKSTYYSLLAGNPVRTSTARTIALKLGVTLHEITASSEVLDACIAHPAMAAGCS